MTATERLMRALHREKPDRLPVSVHQWQPYHLGIYLGGISDPNAFARFGMDEQIQYFESMGQFWLVDADSSRFSPPPWWDDVKTISDESGNRIADHTIKTPEGVLTYKTDGVVAGSAASGRPRGRCPWKGFPAGTDGRRNPRD